MTRIKTLTKGRIISFENLDNYIKYYKGEIVHIKNGMKNKSISIIDNWFLRILSKFRITSRILRIEPRAIAEISETEILFSFKGKVFYYDIISQKLNVEHIFRKGMNNPLYLTTYFENGEMVVLYGEYFANFSNEEVKVFKRINGTWSVAYVFSPNTIFHIHNIIYNKDKHDFLILSGDNDNQSAIWHANIDFSNVEIITGGSQLFRSCFGFYNRLEFNYFMDSPLQMNYFVKLTANEIIKKQVIEGPVIFGKYQDKIGVISTTVEPDSRLKGIRYLLSRRNGAGILNNKAHIYTIDDVLIKKVCSLSKDTLPSGLFQFGTLIPVHLGEDYIILYAIALKHYDGNTILLETR